MATSQMSEVIQHLRRAVLVGDGAGMTDGELLECFVGRRDEAAFAALVRRHGPMVWGVCRRVLSNHQDAEDAFQATFLVLVRRAASVVPREMVANWLYGVAHQTAIKARALVAKRKGRERQVTQMPEPISSPRGSARAASPRGAEHDVWRDLQPLLDGELSRLPDRYRAVIVLCELEGRTRREAAQHLGVPEGTVGGWLARARALLARRLARRGLAVSGASLAAALSQQAASASVPAAVVSNTIQAAGPLVAGQAACAISPQVATLTEGVLKAMFLTRLKRLAALLVVAGVVALGSGVAHFSRADTPAGVAAFEDPSTLLAPAQRPAKEPAQRPKAQPKEGTTVAGKLETVDADKNTVTVGISNRKEGASEKTYPLAKDAKVSQDGNPAKLADLKKGSRVTLRLSEDQKSAVSVSVSGATLTAPLKSVDATKSTVTIVTETRQGKQDRTLQVAKGAKLLIDGKEAQLGDLKAGTPLVFTFAAAEANTVVQIRTPPRREREEND
jgi:RNA polymerase sigma factor (sigma-70 family)